jgi:uroporphyrinogen decarboxylase
MMNGVQRIQSALRGEAPDRAPVMLHNFMMAAAEAGVSMKRFREDPAEVCRAMVEAVERYGYDGVVLDMDTVTLAGALGVPVDAPEDMPARACGVRVRSLEEVADLPAPEVWRDGKVQVWLEAVRLMRRAFGEEVWVRGNSDQGPFSLACAMRGMDEWMIDLMEEEKRPLVEALLDYCAEGGRQMIRLMKGAGAHMISTGDSPAGPDLISPGLYRKFALPWERMLAEEAHAQGLPWLLHVCGKTDRILEDLASTGADALELDYKTDAGKARAAFEGRVTFVGNIDPSGVLALGTPALVAEKTRALLEAFRGCPRFILNAGCAIPATTPGENLKAMIEASQAFG